MICTIGDFIFESTKNKTEKKKNQELAEELMKLHQEYHDCISQEPYATQGSILCCTYGTKLTSLDTTATADVCDIGTRLPILVCNACEVGKNIYSFYSCRAPESSDLPMREILAGGYRKCVPLLNGEWEQENEKTPLLWNSTTDECSYVLKGKSGITCKYRGRIGIIEIPEKEVDNTDDFEKELRTQGFTDCYMKHLMKLHEKYPEWIFEAINTTVDYEQFVNYEVSKID